MADLSDVENALVSAVSAAVFAGTPYIPGTMQANIGGQQVLIGRGWPTAKALDTALSAGQSYITIFSQPNSSRDTTRYPAVPVTVSQVPITLTATITNTTVALNGTCTAGQVVGVIVGGVGYSYRITNADTPDTVKDALAALIPGAS